MDWPAACMAAEAAARAACRPGISVMPGPPNKLPPVIASLAFSSSVWCMLSPTKVGAIWCCPWCITAKVSSCSTLLPDTAHRMLCHMMHKQTSQQAQSRHFMLLYRGSTNSCQLQQMRSCVGMPGNTSTASSAMQTDNEVDLPAVSSLTSSKGQRADLSEGVSHVGRTDILGIFTTPPFCLSSSLTPCGNDTCAQLLAQ